MRLWITARTHPLPTLMALGASCRPSPPLWYVLGDSSAQNAGHTYEGQLILRQSCVVITRGKAVLGCCTVRQVAKTSLQSATSARCAAVRDARNSAPPIDRAVHSGPHGRQLLELQVPKPTKSKHAGPPTNPLPRHKVTHTSMLQKQRNEQRMYAVWVV